MVVWMDEQRVEQVHGDFRACAQPSTGAPPKFSCLGKRSRMTKIENRRGSTCKIFVHADTLTLASVEKSRALELSRLQIFW